MPPVDIAEPNGNAGNATAIPSELSPQRPRNQSSAWPRIAPSRYKPKGCAPCITTACTPWEVLTCRHIKRNMTLSVRLKDVQSRRKVVDGVLSITSDGNNTVQRMILFVRHP